MHRQRLRYKEPAILKVAEVVLLQQPVAKNKQVSSRRVIAARASRLCASQLPAQAFINSMRADWTAGHEREVQIVDGQQRITTVLLIYAALHYQLYEQHQQCLLSAKLEEGGARRALEQQAKQASDKMAKIAGRLRFEVGRAEGFRLVLERGFADSWSLKTKVTIPAVLNIDGKPTSAGCCLWDIMDQPAKQHDHREDKSFVCINVWLGDKVLRAARSPGRQPESAVGRLIALLETLDKHVVWTTTLTPHRSLALQTFVNYNLDSGRMSLAPLDVIKVAIISHAVSTAGSIVLQWF